MVILVELCRGDLHTTLPSVAENALGRYAQIRKLATWRGLGWSRRSDLNR
jgi:hypothetical protein